MKEDDVIERMAKGMYGAEKGGSAPDWGEAHEWVCERFRRRCLNALRAVHATHRLVPVGPTEAMVEAATGFPGNLQRYSDGESLRFAIKAAPDYTLPFGEDTADAEEQVND